MTVQQTCGAGPAGASPAKSRGPFRGSGTSTTDFARRDPVGISATRWLCRGHFLLALTLLIWVPTASAQVSPSEITNPQLKALETEYLPQLGAMRTAIRTLKFPFELFVSRYVTLDPKQQAGADERGLEFVHFHNHTVLKISANYNAAYDSTLLTRNQRAGRVFNDVVVPVLRLIPDFFTPQSDFDRFGFEISYHVRARSGSYDYEGREILAVVLGKAQAFSYASALTDSQRQSILNASDIYVNGKEFGLALSEAQPYSADELASLRQIQAARKDEATPETKAVSVSPTSAPPIGQDGDAGAGTGKATAQTDGGLMEAGGPRGAGSAAKKRDLETLQRKSQVQLDALAKEGSAQYHFVDCAPPSFVVFRDQIYLQVTMRNPKPFEKNTSSIYKRAAQSFDLFLAPMLKSLLDRAPADEEIAGFDITVLHDFGADAKESPEALELVLPLAAVRKLTAAEITSQQLVNQSIVLVNGVRIALNLQQVEGP